MGAAPAPHTAFGIAMKTLIAAVAVVISCAFVSAQGSPPSAAELAAALQRKIDSIRDFSADFTHQHVGGVLRRKVVEQGSVVVKKPGKMRWDYTSPEKKVFVSDGTRIYFHDIPNNQVTVSDVPQGDQAASAALFLTGKGNLTRDFNPSFLQAAAGAPPNTHALRLDPKTPQSEYDWLEIVVDRDTLLIRSLTAAETEGGRSTFLFSKLKENVGVGDKPFEFQIPRGAEVIHAGRAKL
jgi:outer membrane lipoprotein carrier protein